MNIDGSNRRDFLKIAGMTVAGLASVRKFNTFLA